MTGFVERLLAGEQRAAGFASARRAFEDHPLAPAGSPRLLAGGLAVAQLHDPVATLGVDAVADSGRRAVLAARALEP